MKFILPLLACVLVAHGASISESNSKDQVKNFDNFVVYKIFPQNESQRKKAQNLESMQDYFSFWYTSASEMHVMVNPEGRDYFENFIKLENIESSLWIPNLQKLIDNEQSSPDTLDAEEGFSWTRYHSLDDIYAFLDDMLSKYPDVTEPIVLGNTYEGRPIRGIKISYKANNPGIFIESNVHAREWITSATATWFIKELLSSENTEVRDIAENHDWYIIPVLNVDGFIYSHDVDRMWRKNRQNFGKCDGVDINRNFPTHWLENGGSSDDPCSESYAGPEALSTPEAQAETEYILNIKDKINFFVAIHSYGQQLLTPYGYTADEKPANDADLKAVAKSFVDVVKDMTSKTVYTYGGTAEILYVASGVVQDWTYEQGIQMSYAIELRDKGRYGFILPSIQIIPVCEETMAGFIPMLKKARELGYMNTSSQ